MKQVLDSSVGFKWLVVEPHTDKARRLRDDFRAGLVDLLAPDVFPIEIAHALTRAERQGRITPAQVTTLPQLIPALPLLPRAHAISSQWRVGVYDCLYVALAERQSCQLVTADDKLLKNLQPHFPFIVSLASLP